MDFLGDRTNFKEDKLSQTFSNCGKDLFVKIAGGAIIGWMMATLFVAKSPQANKCVQPAWPVIVGTGVGLGIAAENCKRECKALLTQPIEEPRALNPLTIPKSVCPWR